MSVVENTETNVGEIDKIISSKKYSRKKLVDALEKYNPIKTICELNSDTLEKNIDIQKNIEAFRKFYFFQTKYFFNGETMCGLTHIRLAFFVKESKRYENYIKVLIDKLTKSIAINDKYNEKKGKFYVYLDLDNVNPKNFSRKFLRQVADVMNKTYEDQLINYFIGGKTSIIKMFWPFISMILDKKTKQKIIILE